MSQQTRALPDRRLESEMLHIFPLTASRIVASAADKNNERLFEQVWENK